MWKLLKSIGFGIGVTLLALAVIFVFIETAHFTKDFYFHLLENEQWAEAFTMATIICPFVSAMYWVSKR